jgi:hypothetical protein
MIIAAAAIVATSLWFAEHVRNRRKAAVREARYQAILRRYSDDLKVGMNRDEVERYLETSGAQFRQMCCVANLRGQYVSLNGAAWDDLVKIGDESPPFFCGENNVYIAFEFNPKAQGELSGTNRSDSLKKVSISHELERCW